MLKLFWNGFLMGSSRDGVEFTSLEKMLVNRRSSKDAVMIRECWFLHLHRQPYDGQMHLR